MGKEKKNKEQIRKSFLSKLESYEYIKLLSVHLCLTVNGESKPLNLMAKVSWSDNKSFDYSLSNEMECGFSICFQRAVVCRLCSEQKHKSIIPFQIVWGLKCFGKAMKLFIIMRHLWYSKSLQCSFKELADTIIFLFAFI